MVLPKVTRRPPSPLQPHFLVLLPVRSDSRTWKGESGISPGSARLDGVLSELSGARPGGNLLSEFPESEIAEILQHTDGRPQRPALWTTGSRDAGVRVSRTLRGWVSLFLHFMRMYECCDSYNWTPSLINIKIISVHSLNVNNSSGL